MISKPPEVPRYDPNTYVKIPNNYVIPPPNKSQMNSSTMNKNYSSNQAAPSLFTPQNQSALNYAPKQTNLQNSSSLNQNYNPPLSNSSTQRPLGPQVVVPQIDKVSNKPNNILPSNSKPIQQNYQLPSSQAYRSNSPIYSNSSFQPNSNTIPTNNQNSIPNSQSIGKGLTNQMYNLSISQKPNIPPSPSSLNQNNPQYIPNSNINPSMPILQNQNKNSVIKPPPTIVTLTPSQPAKSNTSYNPPSSNYKPTDIQIIKHNPTTGHPQNIPHAISPNLNQQNNFQYPLIIQNHLPSSDNNSQNLPNTSQKELTN